MTINEQAAVRAEILDLDGRFMLDFALNNWTTILDVSCMATGVYILRTISDDGLMKKKRILVTQ